MYICHFMPNSGVSFSPGHQCVDTPGCPTIQLTSDTSCRERQTVQVKGSVRQDRPGLTLVPSTGGHLRLWQAGGRLEGPLTSSSGSSNWLEWLTDLGEAFYFLDRWFIVKGEPDGRDAQGKVRRQHKGFPRPQWVYSSPHMNLHGSPVGMSP